VTNSSYNAREAWKKAMSTEIICYVETLSSDMKWKANNAHTFEIASAWGNDPWPEMLPNYTKCDYGLFGLLAMGIKTSFPFSFAQRGFPSNSSDEVTKVFKATTNPEGASWITREELEGKIGELTIITDQQALVMLPRLTEFLKKLPEHSGDPKHQRIVFWFE
jgi:hypothetical protein